MTGLSPGVVDTGIWGSLGSEAKENPFLTGVTLRVDGGEPLT